jgi:poly(A) polymerase/tRNA nucleotidyltransferase (CCA-adding enzyme)
VSFSKNIDDDLKRRDFTFNAIAYRPRDASIIDHFGGKKDLESGILRAVGNPVDRFREDALRILRAIRIAAEYAFVIEADTLAGILESAETLEKIAKERIRDEFIRILMSDRPMEALFLMKQTGVLHYTVPELERAVGVEQNQAHKYTVFEHLLRSVQHAADKKMPLDVRLAALFHDISKPETRRKGAAGEWTFYGHEVVGSRVTQKILEKLRFPTKLIDKVVLLVRWHMFFSDPDQITLSAVRRMVSNVGEENIDDLLAIRICDRIGTGRPKEQPFRFRKYKSMVDEVRRDPISVAMLKIDGKRVMEVTGEKPGPRIGYILHALLEEVLDDPKKNEAEYLEDVAKNMSKLDDSTLRSHGEEGKRKQAEEEERELKAIREKHFVE